MVWSQQRFVGKWGPGSFPLVALPWLRSHLCLLEAVLHIWRKGKKRKEDDTCLLLGRTHKSHTWFLLTFFYWSEAIPTSVHEEFRKCCLMFVQAYAQIKMFLLSKMGNWKRSGPARELIVVVIICVWRVVCSDSNMERLGLCCYCCDNLCCGKR